MCRSSWPKTTATINNWHDNIVNTLAYNNVSRAPEKKRTLKMVMITIKMMIRTIKITGIYTILGNKSEHSSK